MDSKFYERRVCKGLCVQLDSVGLCMGLCTTEPSYVQRVYDHAKKQSEVMGKPFNVIPYYAEQSWRRDAAVAWMGGMRLSEQTSLPAVHYIYSRISTNTLSEPTWCTTAPSDAHLFELERAEGRLSGPHLMPVYVKFSNLLIIESRFDSFLSPKQLSDALSLPERVFEGVGDDLYNVLKRDSVVTMLRERGFDAIQVVTQHGNAILGFSPQQFKSALGNSGRFNPHSATLTDFEKLPARKVLARREAPLEGSVSPTRKLG